MPIVLIPLIVVVINDFLKVLSYFAKTGKFKLSLMFKSGGMPSGHTAFVSSVSTVVFLELGSGSLEFMIATILSIIVIYDARGIRKKSGDHAKMINKIQEKEIKEGKVEKLDEILGHTNTEVAVGFILSVLISFFLWQTGEFVVS